MPKLAPYRLRLESYPLHTLIQTRHADLDLNNHINNVSMATIFEEGRVRLLFKIRGGAPRDQFRGMVATQTYTYLNEAFYGTDIEMGLGVAMLGTTSWHVHACAFQNGAAVAACDSVAVRMTADGPTLITEEWRARFSEFLMRAPD